MSEIKCVICARRDHADGWTMCRPCLDRLDDNLARIAELTRLAGDKPTTRVAGEGGGTRGKPTGSVPLNLTVVDAQNGNDAWPWLETWERLVRELLTMAAYATVWPLRNAESNRSGVPLPLVYVKASTGFLRAQLLRIVELGDFPIEEFATEAHDLRWKLEPIDDDKRCPAHRGWEWPPVCRACDLANSRAGLAVPCAADHPDADGRRCGYELRIDPKMPNDELLCRRCHTSWTSGRLILVALNDPGVVIWAYPDVIEDALGIPKRTLQRWGQDGVVRRRGTQYDVGGAFRTRHTKVGT